MTTSPEANNDELHLKLQATIFIEVIASDNTSAGNVVMCNSLDLSPHGLQVIVDEELSIGTILRLCVDLRDAEPIFLVGEVKTQRPDAETGGYRIEFEIFESDDYERWEALLKELDTR